MISNHSNELPYDIDPPPNEPHSINPALDFELSSSQDTVSKYIDRRSIRRCNSFSSKQSIEMLTWYKEHVSPSGGNFPRVSAPTMPIGQERSKSSCSENSTKPTIREKRTSCEAIALQHTETEEHEFTKKSLFGIECKLEQLQAECCDRAQYTSELEEHTKLLNARIKDPESIEVLRGQALDHARMEIKQLKRYIVERDQKIVELRNRAAGLDAVNSHSEQVNELAEEVFQLSEKLKEREEATECFSRENSELKRKIDELSRGNTEGQELLKESELSRNETIEELRTATKYIESLQIELKAAELALDYNKENCAEPISLADLNPHYSEEIEIGKIKQEYISKAGEMEREFTEKVSEIEKLYKQENQALFREKKRLEDLLSRTPEGTDRGSNEAHERKIKDLEELFFHKQENKEKATQNFISEREKNWSARLLKQEMNLKNKSNKEIEDLHTETRETKEKLAKDYEARISKAARQHSKQKALWEKEEARLAHTIEQLTRETKQEQELLDLERTKSQRKHWTQQAEQKTKLLIQKYENKLRDQRSLLKLEFEQDRDTSLTEQYEALKTRHENEIRELQRTHDAAKETAIEKRTQQRELRLRQELNTSQFTAIKALEESHFKELQCLRTTLKRDQQNTSSFHTEEAYREAYESLYRSLESALDSLKHQYLAGASPPPSSRTTDLFSRALSEILSSPLNFQWTPVLQDLESLSKLLAPSGSHKYSDYNSQMLNLNRTIHVVHEEHRKQLDTANSKILELTTEYKEYVLKTRDWLERSELEKATWVIEQTQLNNIVQSLQRRLSEPENSMCLELLSPDESLSLVTSIFKSTNRELLVSEVLGKCPHFIRVLQDFIETAKELSRLRAEKVNSE